MKTKTKKILLWGCGSVLALVVVLILVAVVGFLILTRDNRIAKDPSRIAKDAGFDLPSYVVQSQDDNMDRGASAWSSYEWKILLDEPLGEKSLNELEKLVKKNSHWAFDSEERAYTYEIEEDDRHSTIIIPVDDRTVWLSYMWWDILF